MQLIVITLPHLFDGEAAAITSLFDAGLETLHLRKPSATSDEVARLLGQLPGEYMPRIVTHEHFALAPLFGLKGIHLNGRHPLTPPGYAGHISGSCHSLHEVVRRKATCDYLFLSPIYDSISKEGYASAHTSESLRQAQQDGIIDSKVIALGGITQDHIPQLHALGFGGIALLGDIWQRAEADLLPHFLALKETIHSL